MNKDEKILKQFTSKEYEHGWSVDLDVDQAPNGLNENIIKLISKKKNEPNWLLKWRLNAFSIFKKMKSPDWANLKIPKINFQEISYYSAPKQKQKLNLCRIHYKTFSTNVFTPQHLTGRARQVPWRSPSQQP